MKIDKDEIFIYEFLSKRGVAQFDEGKTNGKGLSPKSSTTEELLKPGVWIPQEHFSFHLPIPVNRRTLDVAVDSMHVGSEMVWLVRCGAVYLPYKW